MIKYHLHGKRKIMSRDSQIKCKKDAEKKEKKNKENPLRLHKNQTQQ